MNKLHISLSYTRNTGLASMVLYDLTDDRTVAVATRNFNRHPHTTAYHGIQPTAEGLDVLNDPDFPLYDPFYQWALWHIARVQTVGDELMSDSGHGSVFDWVAEQDLVLAEVSLGMLMSYAELLKPLYRMELPSLTPSVTTASRGKPRSLN